MNQTKAAENASRSVHDFIPRSLEYTMGGYLSSHLLLIRLSV